MLTAEQAEWRQVAEAFELARTLDKRRRDNRLAYYRPYPFQQNFHLARAPGGELAKQRLLMAANQVGKTLSGASETAIHATGNYLEWWQGPRLVAPRLIWVGGVNNDKVRDIGQKELLGDPHDPEAFGTGAIPKERIVRTVRKPGVPDAFEAVVVRHKDGHNVTIAFKSYDAGKLDWAGDAVDFVWLDEEPEQDIYGQALARTINTGGFLIMTFTPENGATQVVQSFEQNLQPGQQLYRATWDDAPHLTEEAKAQILAAIPEHERDMRSRGEPSMGSGLVFSVPDDMISVEPFDIPKTWPRGNGMDFGWDHPTALGFMALDRQTDKIYLYDTYKQRKVLPPIAAEVIKAKGRWIPTFWPRDGLQSDKGSGVSLSAQYMELGVNMHLEHFRNPPTPEEVAKGSKGNETVEPGLMEMLNRMTSDRFKVFSNQTAFFEEKRMYHRKNTNGKVALVKLNEDLISGCRYGVQMRRYWKVREEPVMSSFAIGSLGAEYDAFQGNIGR